MASLLLGLHQVRAQSAVGVISKLTGTVRIARAGAKLHAGNGTALLPWDNLTLEAQSSLTITFNNGSAVALEGPLEFLVDVSDSLAPMKSRPAELMRKFSGEPDVWTFKASAMGVRAERERFASESFGAFSSHLHRRRVRERMGSVLKVTGTAHVTKPDSITLVHDGTAIDAGDELTTDAGASLALMINDDSTIALGERSQLVAGSFADTLGAGQHGTMSFSLTAGSACLRLSKRFLELWPGFSVLTPNADVRVKAQKLTIEYSDRTSANDGPSTEVAVAQGTAAVSNRIEDEKRVEVGAGYETIVRPMRAPSSPKAAASTHPCRQ